MATEGRIAPDEYVLVCPECDVQRTEEYLRTARDLVTGHREQTGHPARLEVPLDAE